MKTQLRFFIAITVFLFYGAAWGQVIISQYYEGSSYDKWIEVTNIGESSVDLSIYYLARWANTSSPSGEPSSSNQLSGTLSSGASVLYQHSSAVNPTYATGTAITSVNFNGDDPMALTTGGTDWSNRVDCIYSSGTWGENTSFYRNDDVLSGNTNISVLDGTGEWTKVTNSSVDNASSGDTEYLGTHIFSGSGNTPPSISNITQTPASGINSSTTVSVSATVTDNDGTIAGVELHWGTTSGSLSNIINMSNLSGDTYETDSDIPAQTGGSTVYYEIYALDNDSGESTSDEQSYAVLYDEPSNHPSGISATANSSSEITVSWTDSDADNYLIKGSDVGYGDISDPVDGSEEANSTLVQNVASVGGANSYQFSGLSATTTYYFKIFAYNGSGSTSNYKTDATLPTASATTEDSPAIVINEILADPDATNGDANGDGTVDTEEDEFVELYNDSDDPINISGYKIKDATDIARHTFPTGTYLQPHDVVVVFGGGTPTGFDHLDVMVSSSGILGLNNGGDDIKITDADDNVLVSYTYGSEGGDNQSLTRDPDVTGSFVKHSTTTGGALFSPAKKIDATFFKEPTVWNGTAKSTDWSASGNWSAGVPDGDNRVVIPGLLSTYPTISATATCNSITMKEGATLLGQENLTVNGTATIEKQINGYTNNQDGWNIITTPVNGMAIPGSDWVPVSGEDDFYAYDESENLWRNYLDPSNPTTWFDYFDVGTGFLVAYHQNNDGIKSFTGNFNSDESYTFNLSYGNTGWNLAGNPYPSKVNGGTMNLASSMKFIDATDGSYDDVAGDVDIGQGFMVYAEGEGASISTTRGNQTHGSVTKTNDMNRIKFIASTPSKEVHVWIVIDEASTPAYEWQHDSRYLAPITELPRFCMITSDEINVSTNSFNTKENSQIIPISFNVMEDEAVTFSLENFHSNGEVMNIILEDIATTEFTTLSDGKSYTFSASTDDDPNRFRLHVDGSSSINETIANLDTDIYTYNKTLYLNSNRDLDAQVNIYNVTGQAVYAERAKLDGLVQINTQLPAGWYVVKVTTGEGMASEKVFIR